MTDHLTYEQAVAELSREGGEFEVGEQTIRGIKYRVFRNLEENLHEYYRNAAEKFGDREFVVYDSTRLSYAEAYAQASALADQLVHRFGIQMGDRVAIGMRNYPEWIVAFMAVTSMGAISVSLNSWWTGEELTYGLQEVGARLAILDRQRWERLTGHTASLNIQVVGARWEGNLPSGVVLLDALLDKSAGKPMPMALMRADDDATILFTSGTTGFPKGAVGTAPHFDFARLRCARPWKAVIRSFV